MTDYEQRKLEMLGVALKSETEARESAARRGEEHVELLREERSSAALSRTRLNIHMTAMERLHKQIVALLLVLVVGVWFAVGSFAVILFRLFRVAF